MRSAEASGAGANGFGAGKGQASNRHPKGGTRPSGAFKLHTLLSPITTAVALTSVLAATLFIIYDTATSLSVASRDFASIGTSLTSEITALASDATPSVLSKTGERYGAASKASFAGSTLSGAPGASASHGTLTSADTDTISGIAQRGAGALALAALVTVLTWRRKRTGMPDMVQRHNYQTMAAAIPLGVACWTQTGQMIISNAQYRDRLNLAGTATTYHDAVKRLIQGGYMKLLSEDGGNKLLELHREDGSCLLIDQRPLSDGAFMTLVSDVTERKKTDMLLDAIRGEQRLLARRYHEEKLKAEAASHAKTNFLAHLSHDIRTPLNHIIGFAELMRHQTYGPLGDVRYYDYVQSIKASGEHLLASFATILDLAELESGQKALRTDPVPVDELIEVLVQRFRGQAKRAGVTFVIGEPCGAVVMGDRLGLQRMVANIVENSVRFTPSGGRVTLAAFAARDGVVIEVTDTGIGMNDDRLATLSQPFALGDATFTREGAGPGLGISISRAIAELSGGHMAIDSSPALGTTVAISLPLDNEAGLQAAE